MPGNSGIGTFDKMSLRFKLFSLLKYRIKLTNNPGIFTSATNEYLPYKTFKLGGLFREPRKTVHENGESHRS